MSLGWYRRISRAHIIVPTFGNQPLSLPTIGSAAGLQAFARHHPEVLEALAFYEGVG